MSDAVFELKQGFRACNVMMHLPSSLGPALLRDMQVGKLGVGAFAHEAFDGGACVLVMVGPAGAETLIPLTLANARNLSDTLIDAIQQAEQLQ